jgi:hypothetical protein
LILIKGGTAAAGEESNERRARHREESMKHLVSASLLALVLSCAIGAAPAHAGRYCLQGDQWGYPGNCGFSTYHQCRASASGTRASCGVNPAYGHQRRAPH